MTQSRLCALSIALLLAFALVEDRPLIEGIPKLIEYAQTGSVTVYFGKEAVEVSDIPDGYWRFSTRRNRLF